MKTFTILSVLVIITWARCTAVAQTADNLILQGRSELVSRNITNANAKFKAAVLVAPNNQSANALYGATRLLCLPYTPAAQEVLDRLGFGLTNRSIYGWTSRMPTDTNGTPIPPNDYSVTEVVDFLRTNVVAEAVAAEANLAKVTDPYFVLSLTTNETKLDQITVDYGDVMLLRALLRGLEFAVHYMASLDSEAQLNALYWMHANGDWRFEDMLNAFPKAGAYTRPAELALAKQAFQLAGQRYLDASVFIRARKGNTLRLFNLATNAVAAEGAWRTNLNQLLASLAGPTALTLPTNGLQGIQVNLKQFFAGARAPRNCLPQIQDKAVIAGSLPDKTFGGAVVGLSDSDVYAGLGKWFSIPVLPKIDKAVFPGLLVHGIDGVQYSVQVSANLVAWQEVSASTPTGGVFRVTAPWTVGQQGIFLRVEDLSQYVTFVGTVVDAVTGAPIANASVGSSCDSRRVTTDAKGAFFLRTSRLAGSAGAYALDATSSGYGRAGTGGFDSKRNRITGIQIRALKPPTITVQPVDQVALEGGAVSVILDATASPPPTYLWLKNGKQVAGLPTARLITFNPVKLTDAGGYSAVVTSTGGSVTSRVATLTVSPKPMAPAITQQPIAAIIKVGGKFTVSVVATGSPTPTYQWLKNGVAIPGATSVSYTIAAVKLSDAGLYSVTAANSSGKATSTSARLTVQ